MNQESANSPSVELNMEETLHERLCGLVELVLEWRKLYMQALGFKRTVEFNRILFHVSEYSVIADLSPLAYLDLVEEIGDRGVQAAVATLYERLRPLLECQHCWHPLTTQAPRELVYMDFSLVPNSYIQVCTKCTGHCVKFV